MVKCLLCKQEIEMLQKHIVENECPFFRKHTATLKETNCRCPDCGSIIKELYPNEWFWCEKCDTMFDQNELSKQDRHKK